MEGFEGGVFGLDGVDFGDWGGVSGFGLDCEGCAIERIVVGGYYLSLLCGVFRRSIRRDQCISFCRRDGLRRGLGLIGRGECLVGFC